MLFLAKTNSFLEKLSCPPGMEGFLGRGHGLAIHKHCWCHCCANLCWARVTEAHPGGSSRGHRPVNVGPGAWEGM